MMNFWHRTVHGMQFTLGDLPAPICRRATASMRSCCDKDSARGSPQTTRRLTLSAGCFFHPAQGCALAAITCSCC